MFGKRGSDGGDQFGKSEKKVPLPVEETVTAPKPVVEQVAVRALKA